MNEQTNIAAQATKVVTVWAAIGITSWAEAASFLAFTYSFVLLSEWIWKKIIRPLCVRRGWIKPTIWTPDYQDRRKSDDDSE